MSSLEEKILDVFKRKQRPLLVGELSLECVQSTDVIEKKLFDLELRGAVAQLPISETFERGLDSRTLCFKLIDASKFTKTTIVE